MLSLNMASRCFRQFLTELAHEISALKMRIDKHDEELVHIIEAIE